MEAKDPSQRAGEGERRATEPGQHIGADAECEESRPAIELQKAVRLDERAPPESLRCMKRGGQGQDGRECESASDANDQGAAQRWGDAAKGRLCGVGRRGGVWKGDHVATW